MTVPSIAPPLDFALVSSSNRIFSSFFFFSLLFLFPRDLFAGSSFPSPLCVCVCVTDTHLSIIYASRTVAARALVFCSYITHGRMRVARHSQNFLFFSSFGLILFNLFVFINSDFYDFFFSFYKSKKKERSHRFFFISSVATLSPSRKAAGGPSPFCWFFIFVLPVPGAL